MRKIFFLIFGIIFLQAYKVKTPSDVYAVAMVLKQKVQYLKKETGIDTPFPKVAKQYNKYPRHVIQKALEILRKINLYRISKGYGEISIPPYPARDITPSDVFEIVQRINLEVTPLIKNKKFLTSLKCEKKSYRKTPNDVYQLLWSISLAFNSLLGIHGNTPTDVYILSQKLVDIASFIRHTQNMYEKVEMPKYIPNLYPNHSLKQAYKFTEKLKSAEEHLWIQPTEIPRLEKKVITPTEVYDALQYNIAELQRIKYRLGVERYFKLKPTKSVKNASDVVQNIKYAYLLMPLFKMDRDIIQYPISSLKKTPNNVYSVTEEVLKKIEILKSLKGIQVNPKNPPYIEGLKPIYAYQKSLENIYKAIKMKQQMGFLISEVPHGVLRKITPDDVYDIVIRLDSIVTILLHKVGYTNAEEYIYKTDKNIPKNKTPSDVYNNLWKISRNFDLFLTHGYSLNDIFYLSNVLKYKYIALLKKLKIKPELIIEVEEEKQVETSVTRKKVLDLSMKIYEQIKSVQKRLNMAPSSIIIPKDSQITLSTFYNGLRIVNATTNEILIYKKIDEEEIHRPIKSQTQKSLEDVYNNLLKIQKLINLLYKDSNYEN